MVAIERLKNVEIIIFKMINIYFSIIINIIKQHQQIEKNELILTFQNLNF